MRKKLNIIYISEKFNDKNGANKSASDVLFSLIKTGNNIQVISYSSISNLDSNIFDEEDIKNIKWHKIKRKLRVHPKFSFTQIAKFVLFSFSNLFISVRGIELNEVDLIIVNSLGGHQLLENLPIDFNCYRINIFRGSPESFGISGVNFKIDDIIEILKKYHCIIHVSNIVKKKWIKYPQLINISHRYIPNCCEEEKITAIAEMDKNFYRNRLRFNPVNFNIIYIASIQYRKGHDLLIELIPEIVKKIKNAEFYFLGRKVNPYFLKILNYSKDLKIRKRIHFLGEKSDALEYLYASDLLVFPSRAEAMPRVILESMILKTPIVASDVDGIPELIIHGKHGFLFPVKHPDLMINYLEKIYMDKRLSENLVKNAYTRYWTKFSRENHIFSYKKLIDDLAIG